MINKIIARMALALGTALAVVARRLAGERRPL